MLYEINYLVLQSKTSDLEKIRAEMKKIIESFDAKITAEKKYLKRKLSYEINHERYGFFTVLRFEIKDNTRIQELKKNLNIDENVVRYIIVQADKLPTLEEQAKIEADVKRKDTLKQGEIEQVLAEEAKSEKINPETPAEKKSEVKEEVKKIKEKVEKEIKKDKTKNTKEIKEEEIIEKKEVEKTERIKEKIIEKKEVEKVEEVKKEVIEEKEVATEDKEERVISKKSSEKEEKEDDKKNKEGKVSLDELDKKLDEILNL